jgi:ABC-type multidrug transport system ATPase subunit
MLKVVDCSYRYPGADRWAFHSVNLEISRGEIILVKGRNGSGKSTLLKVASGILENTEGSILKSADTQTVYMDQTAADMLALDLTVDEQLSAFRHWKGGNFVPSFEQLKEFGVGLDTRTDEFVGHLSGGQRQIIALLATVHSGANLLCLDEFLSALDIQSSKVARSLIGRLVDDKKISVLAVSHSAFDMHIDRELVLDQQSRGLSG